MPHPLCMVVYRIPEGFIPAIKSHGNSKEDKPFYATLPSTISKIKEECASKGPKEVIEHVSVCVGGVLGASDPGILPHNEETSGKSEKKSQAFIPCICRPHFCNYAGGPHSGSFTYFHSRH